VARTIAIEPVLVTRTDLVPAFPRQGANQFVPVAILEIFMLSQASFGDKQSIKCRAELVEIKLKDLYI
jgi:hypothetical protein